MSKLSNLDRVYLASFDEVSKHDQKSMKEQFLLDLASFGMICPKLQKLQEVLVENPRKLRVNVFSFISASSIKSGYLEVDNTLVLSSFQHHLLLVQGVSDALLVKLGKTSTGFPRGFPIIWIPGIRIQTFGFYPKFENDDKQEINAIDEFKGVVSMNFFLKWSGFLGQIMAYKINDSLFWAVTSKNWGTGSFVEDAIRLFRPCMMQLELITLLAEKRLHVCAEILSFNDQTHGYRVIKEAAIITAIGQGVLATKSQCFDNGLPDAFVRFLSHVEIVQFCCKYNLDVDTAWGVKTEKACIAMVRDIANVRDFMTYSRLQQILQDLFKSSIGSCFSYQHGTVDHKNIVGDVLEGIVFSISFGDNSKTTKKYKFPIYTSRTMCLRPLLSDLKDNISVTRALDRIHEWSENWCISDAGRSFWIYALQQAVECIEKGEIDKSFRNSRVGLHILALDFVLSNTSIPHPKSGSSLSRISQTFFGSSVFIFLGPVGSGKSQCAVSFMNSLTAIGIKSEHIDGDVLDLNMAQVLMLGKERNDYTFWCIARALMRGACPIISCGGGALCTQSGRGSMRFSLPEKLFRTFGVQFKIVSFVTQTLNFQSCFPLALPLELSIFENDKLVENALSSRLARGEWILPTNMTRIAFVEKIKKISKNNANICQTICSKASAIFGCPLITSDDFEKSGGMLKSIRFDEVLPLVIPCHSSLTARFSQKRLLVSLSSEAAKLDRLYHVTLRYSLSSKFEYSIEEADRDVHSLCREFNGRYVELQPKELGNPTEERSRNKKKKQRLPSLVVINGIEIQNAHVTVFAGRHPPRAFAQVAESLFCAKSHISLPLNESDDRMQSYKLRPMISYPFTNVLGVSVFAV